MSPHTEDELKAIAHSIGNIIWSAEIHAENIEQGYGKHQTSRFNVLLLKAFIKLLQRM
jgi:hypothetical protein